MRYNKSCAQPATINIRLRPWVDCVSLTSMKSSSQKETYDSDTPSGSSRRTKSRSSIDGVLHLVFHHDRSSKEIIQSYRGFLSNSSVYTTRAAIHEDLLGVSEQDPFPPLSGPYRCLIFRAIQYPTFHYFWWQIPLLSRETDFWFSKSKSISLYCKHHSQAPHLTDVVLLKISHRGRNQVLPLLRNVRMKPCFTPHVLPRSFLPLWSQILVLVL